MDLARARAILQSLADGHDPTTGQSFPSDSPYQQVDTVRALHAVLDALDGPLAKKRPANPDRPQLGLKWTPEEEKRLRDAFTAHKPIPEIAAAHGRSAGAITSRLVRLGLIEDDFAHPGHRPRPPGRRVGPPETLREGANVAGPTMESGEISSPTQRLPLPPNPKPDDDLPF